MDIIMPKMGESVNEGTIIKWHKKVGDVVKLDEIIFEISTDKVDTEIPAVSAGLLSEIFVKEGETVEVGTVVARIQASGESSITLTNETEKIKLDISSRKDVISKDTESFQDEKSVQEVQKQISPSLEMTVMKLQNQKYP